MSDPNQGASLFNPDTFLDTEIGESLSTKPVLIPVADGYQSLIKNVQGRTVVSGEGKKMAFLDITHEIDGSTPVPGDAEGRTLNQFTNRDKATVTDSIILDLTPGGQLDFREGMNFRLGRYREALGQNIPGQPWKPRNMMGQVLKVNISHRYDKNDATIAYPQVKGVEKL